MDRLDRLDGLDGLYQLDGLDGSLMDAFHMIQNVCKPYTVSVVMSKHSGRNPLRLRATVYG